MRIKEIELVFENCEVITIPGNISADFTLAIFAKVFQELLLIRQGCMKQQKR